MSSSLVLIKVSVTINNIIFKVDLLHLITIKTMFYPKAWIEHLQMESDEIPLDEHALPLVSLPNKIFEINVLFDFIIVLCGIIQKQPCVFVFFPQ